jgi:predicted O-methyltransferase YrrM
MRTIVREIFPNLTLKKGARPSYGALPNKVATYEELYDYNTGGWYKVDAQSLLNSTDQETASVELEVGRFWYAFVRLTKPKNVLETGTYKGYSTSCIATALRDINEDGHIYTIDPEKNEYLWKDTDIEPFITPVHEFSQNSVHLFEDKRFDLLVLDSDHSYNTAIWELIHFEKLLTIGGHILMHDTLFYDGVGAAVKPLYQNPRFEVVTFSSPRNHNDPELRCPGISIIKKIAEGAPELTYEESFDGWVIGDARSAPYLYRPT